MSQQLQHLTEDGVTHQIVGYEFIKFEEANHNAENEHAPNSLTVGENNNHSKVIKCKSKVVR